MSAVTHPPVPVRSVAPVVRITGRPLVQREPRPIRSTTEPRVFRCPDGFDDCAEAVFCQHPGRCSQNRGVTA